MNKSLVCMPVAVLMIAVAPTFAGVAAQMWKCELGEDATEAQVMEGARKWLAAAKTVQGGKNFEAFVYHPVAVNFPDNSDLMFVVIAPSFKEWGEFWDAYPDSPAAEVEEETDKFIICPDSVVWEATTVEPKKETKGAAASSAHKATQMWRCELEDEATEEQVMEGAQEWLTAARTVPGGKNLEAYVYHPVAVNATGQIDLVFIITAPTFKEWGEFWDAYPGSAAAAVEAKTDKFVICPDSALWEVTKVE